MYFRIPSSVLAKLYTSKMERKFLIPFDTKKIFLFLRYLYLMEILSEREIK